MGKVHLTARELDVMSVLWDVGSGTVAEVRGRLRDELGYTSVLKVLQILEGKGHVRHEEEGRAYRYHPVTRPAEVGGAELRRIVSKVFRGSAELTLASLVSDRELSREEIARMQRILEELSPSEGTRKRGAEAHPGGEDEASPDPEAEP